MRVVVTADGPGLDAPFVPIFGRSPRFVLVDLETLACEDLPNEAVSASGGAGIQAAQAVVDKGGEAVITGQVGPNAHRVLQAAGVPIYLFGGGTVQQAVQAYKAGWLQATSGATAPGHSGLGMVGGSGVSGAAGLAADGGTALAGESRSILRPRSVSPPRPRPKDSKGLGIRVKLTTQEDRQDADRGLGGER